MEFSPYALRYEIVALLEDPVRKLLADGATTRPVADLVEIIAELDRRDAADASHDHLTLVRSGKAGACGCSTQVKRRS